ncbi:hypothetical protein MTQ13_24435 [Streptomyces sp. XM4011]|uniref:hypothetical protein n=1 Tax=Streptomyces sp. XM4011 TaxID=2929780 RepID=UPI001FFADF63|nr:hypothetical protein [Streptomyces sp. XM4011]MCK1817391.1 hypothetical protein [Streptomyces sp. XM4011]
MQEPTAAGADEAEQVTAPPPLIPMYRRRPVVAHVRYACGCLGPRDAEHDCQRATEAPAEDADE